MSQVFHNMFIFSTIKSHLRLSCVFALILSFLLDVAIMVDILKRIGDRGGVWRNKKLRVLHGYGSGRSAGDIHLLVVVVVRSKHPFWWNCMSLIRRID